MTDRLYYHDSYLTEFEGRVLDVRPHGHGHGVVLDRTAFYPASGGQPCDTGTLGGARVVDVIDQDDGSILHVVEGEPPAGAVAARVDWDRRFEHMQQHTGQHVLSAAFDRLFGVRTLSFHLGSSTSTIDLARELTAGEIARAEEAANEVVWSDRPVVVRFVDAAEAASLPLRKEPLRGGRLRIVEVEGFDMSACGGTHVARTGSIGIVVVSAWERFKGGSRLEFRCGVRALRVHRQLRDVLNGAAQLMSAPPGEVPAGIERQQAEIKELRRRARDLEAKLARHEAQAMAARAEAIGGRRVVFERVEEADANGLKTLAQYVAALGCGAVLCTVSAPLAVVIASAPAAAIDSAALLKQLLSRFGGKGGGRPELAQGSGLSGSPDEILAAARSLLT